jgi:hypothetical protein
MTKNIKINTESRRHREKIEGEKMMAEKWI